MRQRTELQQQFGTDLQAQVAAPAWFAGHRLLADFAALEGWHVESKERQKLGYDLLCSHRSAVDHVEVKGISGAACVFQITMNEAETAKLDRSFKLIAVTDARDGSRRRLWRFTGTQFARKFRLVPISYMALLR